MKKKRDWLDNLIVTPIDWAYLAGLVDGEGSFYHSIKRRWGKTYKEPMMTVMNCSLLFRDYMEHMGFKIRRERRSNYKSKTGRKWQDKYAAIIYGNSAFYLIEELLPYLVLKKPVALIMRAWMLERLKQKYGTQLTETPKMAELAALVKHLNSKQREKLYPLEKSIIKKYSAIWKRRRITTLQKAL